MAIIANIYQKVTTMVDEFYSKLRKEYEGSLVKTKIAKSLDENAKEYLYRLAKEGFIEYVSWGWYFIGTDTNDFMEFIGKDKNLKIIAGQSAASFWNYDFVHRDSYTILVNDKSYMEAMKQFVKLRGWDVGISYSNILPMYVKKGNLLIEDLEPTIFDCIDRWAFLDAFSVVYVQRKKIDLIKLVKENYWRRIPKSDIRTGQILGYGFKKLNQAIKKNTFPAYKTNLKDTFITRSIDESIERVIEFA